MKTSILRAGVRHRLVQQMNSQSRRSRSAINRGFTLIELMVVVIIVGILAAIALPSFTNQAAKARIAAAKALAMAGSKECQVWLLDPPVDPATKQPIVFKSQTDDADDSITYKNTCSLEGGISKATISNGGGEFTVTTTSPGGEANPSW